MLGQRTYCELRPVERITMPSRPAATANPAPHGTTARVQWQGWVSSHRPLGGVERPRRTVRFARLIQRRVRAFGRTCGPRRLWRQSQPALVATQGGRDEDRPLARDPSSRA